MARKAVIECIQNTAMNVSYCVVLPYLPTKRCENNYQDISNTIFPEKLEGVPRKFAIDRRNMWMLSRSEVVISYVNRPWGGAAKFVELARRQGKKVYNLYNDKV